MNDTFGQEKVELLNQVNWDEWLAQTGMVS